MNKLKLMRLTLIIIKNFWHNHILKSEAIMKKCYLLFFILSCFFHLSTNGVAQDQTVGLFVNDSAAYKGYTLFAPKDATTTYLIDMNGLLVHKWGSDYKPSQIAYLQENGHLIRAANISSGSQKGGGFQELTRFAGRRSYSDF